MLVVASSEPSALKLTSLISAGAGGQRRAEGFAGGHVVELGPTVEAADRQHRAVGAELQGRPPRSPAAPASRRRARPWRGRRSTPRRSRWPWPASRRPARTRRWTTGPSSAPVTPATSIGGPTGARSSTPPHADRSPSGSGIAASEPSGLTANVAVARVPRVQRPTARRPAARWRCPTRRPRRERRSRSLEAALGDERVPSARKRRRRQQRRRALGTTSQSVRVCEVPHLEPAAGVVRRSSRRSRARPASGRRG